MNNIYLIAAFLMWLSFAKEVPVNAAKSYRGDSETNHCNNWPTRELVSTSQHLDVAEAPAEKTAMEKLSFGHKKMKPEVRPYRVNSYTIAGRSFLLLATCMHRAKA